MHYKSTSTELATKQVMYGMLDGPYHIIYSSMGRDSGSLVFVGVKGQFGLEPPIYQIFLINIGFEHAVSHDKTL